MSLAVEPIQQFMLKLTREKDLELFLQFSQLEGIDDIEEVFLVGGSTRIPLVQQSVKRSFKMTPTATVNVDEVVCLGAALYAAIKGDRSKLNPAQKASMVSAGVS